MNKSRWFFVTAPFIIFTIYTYFVSSSFPDAPVRMRWLVSIFFGFTLMLLIVQRVFKDNNYFVPTLAMVLFVNFILIFSVYVSQFNRLDTTTALGLLLERPQLILYFGLLIMALVPPVLWNNSFTCYFSRLDYPEDAWNNPEFLRANRIISFFWVIIFLLCFLSQFVPILVVQLFTPILIVMTLGAWGTKKLIDSFIRQLEVKDNQ